MQKFILLVLFLILNIQLSVKADDISNLEIEGMSIGDSLLKYSNIKEINTNKVKLYNSDRYTTIEINKNLNTYNYLQISFLTNDVKKKIASLDG